MKRLWDLLRSPRLARVDLLFIGAYAAVAAWLPWARGGGEAPAWARAVGLEHPFSAWPFLLAVALLFASTLGCTWGRRARIARVVRGELPASAVSLAERPGAQTAREFLRARGYAGDGEVLRRNGWALWGGWLFHVGLLLVIAGALVQQAFHDEGAFQIAVGEQVTLATPGTVFQRVAGPLAPTTPPPLAVALEQFEARLRQPGYAADRRSRISVAAGDGGGPRETFELDRAAGVDVGGAVLHQAIPAGIALYVEVPGMGVRAIALENAGRTRARRTVDDLAGRPLVLGVDAERPLDGESDPGRLTLWTERDGAAREVSPGQPFEFGGSGPARIVAVGRWAGFTYARSPGMPAVLAGFAVVLLGSLLLVFPSGVAVVSPPGSGVAARVHAPRDATFLVREWESAPAAAPPS